MSERNECLMCGEHFQWGEIVVPVERVARVGAQSGYVELTAFGRMAHLMCPRTKETPND